MSGWIKLHRELQDKPVWEALTNDGRLVLVAILMNCNYKESSAIIEGQLRTILPGQWLTSIPTIKRLARVTDQNVRTAIKILKVSNFLTDEVTDGNHRIITVINWNIYQCKDMPLTDDVTDAQQTGNRRVTDGVTESKEEELKEGKERKKKELKDLPPLSIFNGLAKVVKCEEHYREALDILNFWNKQPNLTKHRVNKDMLMEIKKVRVKRSYLSTDDIRSAIVNYNQAFEDHQINPESHWYKWSLSVFFTREKGITEFVNGNPWKKETNRPVAGEDKFPWMRLGISKISFLNARDKGILKNDTPVLTAEIRAQLDRL